MLVSGFLLDVMIDSELIDMLLIGPIASIGLFGVVESFDLEDAPIYSFVRSMSTVIYFIHMYVWSVYYKIVYGEVTYGTDCFIVTTGICLAISVIYVSHNNKNGIDNIVSRTNG